MPTSRLRRNVLFAAGFILLGMVLAVLGYAAYGWHTGQLAKRNSELFQSLLPEESLRLERWTKEREADLLHYALSPLARKALAGLDSPRPSPEALGQAAAWFSPGLRAHPEYARVDVLTPAGVARWNHAGPEPVAAPPASLLNRLRGDGDVVFSDLAIEGGRPLVTFLARAGPRVVAIRVDVSHGVLPSLASGSPPAPGGFDVYLARRAGDSVEVADHDPARLGDTRVYPLPADSAVGLALARGAMASGPDHFGRTVFAMPARAAWSGWTPVAAREVGRTQSDSRLLAFVFGALGVVSVVGTFLLMSGLMRSVEAEGTAAHERLELLTRMHEALRVCSAASRLARSSHELAAEICRALVENGSFRFAAFWEARDPERLSLCASYGLQPGTALPGDIPARPSDPAERSASADALATGRAVVVADIAADGRTTKFHAFGLAQGARSAMAVPLGGACAGGVMLVTSTRPDFFKGEARSLVEAIAADFSAACGGFAAAERSLRVDAELAKNKRLLEHIAAALPLGIFVVDLRTREAMFATPALAAIFEAPLDAPHRFGPSFIRDRIHPDDDAAYARFFESFAEANDGEVVESNSRLVMKEGRLKHIRVRGVVFERALAGEATLVLGTVEDVTESVLAAEALEQSWKDYRRVLQAVECAAESIVITDEKGIIQYVNPAVARVTGYTRLDFVGRHTRALKSGVHPPEFYQDLWGTISSGKVWNGRLVNKRKDGSLFEEDASISPVMDEHGAITNYVAVKKDVTKERSLETQLQQSQKLEAVGRLAGGIAHDFNNILTAILGYAQMAQQGAPPGSPLQADLAEIEQGARRAAELTRQLLIFSRKQVIQPRLVPPADLAAGLQKMLRRIVGEDTPLRFTARTDGRLILADPGQFEQVLLNFVVNARDASPEGGDVEISVADRRLAAPVLAVDGEVPPGDYCVLSVKDSGTGIPPDVLPRIFEPFFTTKGDAGGTGLGLSTVYGIVKQANAYLVVDSAVGVGTEMSVFWPAAARSAAVEAPAAAPAPSPGGTERVLLVEDEPAVLELTRRLLTDAGYAVSAFSDARAALAWAARPDARFELLLTDVILAGGLSGRDLAEELARLRPGAKVLFASGYSDDVLSHEGVLDPGLRLLPKPFSRETLLGAVRAALDGALPSA